MDFFSWYSDQIQIFKHTGSGSCKRIKGRVRTVTPPPLICHCYLQRGCISSRPRKQSNCCIQCQRGKQQYHENNNACVIFIIFLSKHITRINIITWIRILSKYILVYNIYIEGDCSLGQYMIIYLQVQHTYRNTNKIKALIDIL